MPADDDEGTPLLGERSGLSRNNSDLDFDAKFKKWKAAVAQKFRRSSAQYGKPVLLVTFFDNVDGARKAFESTAAPHEAASMTAEHFQEQVSNVKKAIAQGIQPKMIAAGSSGSYFARVVKSPGKSSDTDSSLIQSQDVVTVAVFKPKDEEPYGNLNPKRQFLRKYFWWAMGRPCLIPNFSYLSEVGASYLDHRLHLNMVPRTELVELSSPSFHYAFSDRKALEQDGKALPPKVGSYQTFLKGYVNASDFLRKHPWPSTSRSEALMLRDVEDESRAHRVSRKKQKARIRNCGIALKRFVLCRPSPTEIDEPQDRPEEQTTPRPDGFYWTPSRMEQFRLQLEKLVALDYLMRNTDRGLDNFMIKHDELEDQVTVGAIDNSLSFPIKHPNEIRQYPFGWLFLPIDLIGLPFSDQTRQQLLPVLNDPVWWQQTVHGLRQIFQRDPYFSETKFQKQMSVMRGQGWNLVQSLKNEDEGPLDLCAREKRFIRHDVVDVPIDGLDLVEGAKVPIDPQGQVVLESARQDSRQVGSKRPVIASHGLGLAQTTDSVSRRPIGPRASISYRQALAHVAAPETSQPIAWAIPEHREQSKGAFPQSLPGPSTLPGNGRQVDPELNNAVGQPTTSRRPGGHSRMASAQESRRPLRRNISDTATEDDGILGQTGMQVLEELDRERKRRPKLSKNSRPRSSTVSAATPEPSAAAVERQSSGQGAGISGVNGNSEDLATSILSDPGTPTMSGESRQDASDAKISKEDRSKAWKPDLGASIDTLLARAPRPNRDDNVEAKSDHKSHLFTPHLPHASAIAASPTTPDESSRHEASGPQRGTVKIILETMSSEMRQPWLTWI